MYRILEVRTAKVADARVHSKGIPQLGCISSYTAQALIAAWH